MAGREGVSLGPYHLLQRLGGGNTGEVYRAQGPATGSDSSGQVALKILTGGAQDSTTREIARQTQAVSALKQSHVIPIYGVVETGADVAVVMAFAPGGSLGDTLRAIRPDGARKLTLPLTAGVVARLVNQLAHALAAAHEHGLAHGDLKPNNIFVRTSPSGAPLAVVSDFGQSVLTTAAASLAAQSATPADWVGAQLLFAAPEQLRGETLPASDQYALASIAYLLLTGETLHVGDAATLLRAIPHDTGVAPSSLNPELSSETDAVLERALSKQPEARYPSIDLFAQALDGALATGVTASSGLTQQFAQLAASTPGMRRPPTAGPSETPTTTRNGMRIFDRSEPASGLARAARARSDSEALEAEAPRMNRRLGALAGVAVLLLALACAMGFQMFTSGSLFPHIRAIIGSNDTQATATTNPTVVAQARSAVTELSAVESKPPAYSDSLLNNDKQWNVDGTTVFFATDGLHVRNRSTTVAAADAPSDLSGLSSFVSQVDVALVNGLTGDQAGMRFLVQTEQNGTKDFYCYLISAEGRYSIWLEQGGTWTELSNGYSMAIRAGFHQVNTLAVLVTADQRAVFFANRQFVTALTFPRAGPTSGGVGVMVFDGGAEARFSRLEVYRAG